MTQMKADYDRVAAAVRRLADIGEKPTAQKVIAFVGGSKTTVLRHMRQLSDDIASGGTFTEDIRDHVAALVEPLVVRIVSEARRLAREESEDRLHLLAELHAGIAESLEDVTRDLEATLARAEAAEATLAKMEVALDERVEMEEHLFALSEAVHALKGRPDISAMHLAVRIVSNLGDGPGRQEIHRRLRSAGFTDKEGHAARNHAVGSRYLEEIGEPPRLQVTDRGASWLKTQDARAARKENAVVDLSDKDFIGKMARS